MFKWYCWEVEMNMETSVTLMFVYMDVIAMLAVGLIFRQPQYSTLPISKLFLGQKVGFFTNQAKIYQQLMQTIP